MRAALSALAVLLLAACLPLPDTTAGPTTAPAAGERVSFLSGADSGTDPEEPTAPDPPAVAVSPPETSAEALDDILPMPAETQTPIPPTLGAEARACAEIGGTLRARAAGGLWSCVRATGDAGQACTTGADCEGLCLSRSGTCAPFEPLFGCHEALDRAGRPQTVCRE